jgi:hypothetical protein
MVIAAMVQVAAEAAGNAAMVQAVVEAAENAAMVQAAAEAAGYVAMVQAVAVAEYLPQTVYLKNTVSIFRCFYG